MISNDTHKPTQRLVYNLNVDFMSAICTKYILRKKFAYCNFIYVLLSSVAQAIDYRFVNTHDIHIVVSINNAMACSNNGK